MNSKIPHLQNFKFIERNNIHILSFILLGLIIFKSNYGQVDSGNVNKKRLYGLSIGSTGIYCLSLVGLNELWYKNYPQSSFHFFNDNDEWMQIDKVGHAYTAYYESIIGINGLRWSNVEDNKSIIYGSLWGFIFQLPIEIMDGFSTKWGASWGDLAANTVGAGLAFGQEMAWHEQKILFKFSFMPSNLSEKRKEILGNNIFENVIKDYNGQTYWLSTQFNSFTGHSEFFPEWLNISLGYGADGMLGGTENPTPFEDIERYRQFYLSLDINTLKIKTDRKFLKILLTSISFLKFPSPTLEYNSKSEFVFHPIFF